MKRPGKRTSLRASFQAWWRAWLDPEPPAGLAWARAASQPSRLPRRPVARGNPRRAFTLIEALVSMAILGIMVTGVVSGFMQCHRTAEWSAYSLAAQTLAMQAMEQSRAAKWDPSKATPVDDLVASNFPTVIQILDVPVSGTNIVYATNRTTILTLSTNPPLKKVYVECTWRFPSRGIFTNSIFTFRAPDQ